LHKQFTFDNNMYRISVVEKVEVIKLIRDEYEKLDAITNVDTSNICIKISSRLKSKLGYFSVEKKFLSRPILTITISDKVLKDKELFTDVIRHEYAHAVVYLREPNKRHVHDGVWKDVCNLIGCRPKATIKIVSNIKPRSDKYVVTCTKCGTVSRYKSRSKLIKLIENKSSGSVYCKKCSGKEFVLEKICH